MIKTSESNISKIYLMLGFACNFGCKYCIQNQSKTCADLSPEVDENVFLYIEHLVKIRQSGRGKLKIMFWGGEPLLYLSTIKKIINRLGSSVEYGLVTNGELIDEEFVELANTNDISVALSHDGKFTESTRRKNIFKKEGFLEKFNSIKKRGVLGVLSRYNYDFQAFQDYVYKHCKRDTGVTLEMLKLTWAMPKDLYEIDLEKYRKSLEVTAKIAFWDILNLRISNEVRLFLPYLKKTVNQDNIYKDILACRQFYNVMNIDLNGNVYACHNSILKLGNISDNRIYLAKKYTAFLESRKKECCESCKYLNLCQRGCPFESELKSKTCKLRKVFFGVTEKLINELIESYEPIDLEV